MGLLNPALLRCAPSAPVAVTEALHGICIGFLPEAH